MTSNHRHRALTYVERPFSGSVRPLDPNPAAHGNRVRIDTCACGAERRTNFNAGQTESGPWVEREPEQKKP